MLPAPGGWGMRTPPPHTVCHSLLPGWREAHVLSPADLSTLGQVAAPRCHRACACPRCCVWLGPLPAMPFLGLTLLCPDNLPGSFLTPSSAVTPLGDLSQPVPHQGDEGGCVGPGVATHTPNTECLGQRNNLGLGSQGSQSLLDRGGQGYVRRRYLGGVLKVE